MKQINSTIWLIIPAQDRATILRAHGNAVDAFLAESTDDISLAQAIAQAFSEQEYEAQPVLLAPLSSDVLCVTLEPDTTQSRQATLYELEEFLPLAAEEFVADIFTHENARFAGVLEKNKIVTLLDELSTHNILVQSIVPLSILAAQFLSKNPETTDGLRCLIWQYQEEKFLSQDKVEFFLLTADGLPISWQLLDNNSETLRHTLLSAILRYDKNVTVTSPHLEVNLRNTIQSMDRVKLVTTEPVDSEEDVDLLQQAIVRQAVGVLERKNKPWWEFSRDDLAMRGTDKVLGKSTRILLWGAVALSFALCLVLAVRMFRFDQLAATARQEQETAFKQALPEQKISTGFRNRLESEFKKMSAQRENTGDIPKREHALVPLLKIMQALPKNVRYRFPEIRIEENAIRLDGQLQVHGDAELIATALEAAGFTVETPATQQTGTQGVSVRINILRDNK
jgi:hypothetical protein